MASTTAESNPPLLSYPSGKTAKAPKKFKVSPRWPVVISAMTTFAVAGGGLISFVGLSVSSCRGATRSARLRWEQIAADVRESEASSATSALRLDINAEDEPASKTLDSK